MTPSLSRKRPSSPWRYPRGIHNRLTERSVTYDPKQNYLSKKNKKNLDLPKINILNTHHDDFLQIMYIYIIIYIYISVCVYICICKNMCIYIRVALFLFANLHT